MPRRPAGTPGVHVEWTRGHKKRKGPHAARDTVADASHAQPHRMQTQRWTLLLHPHQLVRTPRRSQTTHHLLAMTMQLLHSVEPAIQCREAAEPSTGAFAGPGETSLRVTAAVGTTLRLTHGHKKLCCFKVVCAYLPCRRGNGQLISGRRFMLTVASRGPRLDRSVAMFATPSHPRNQRR